MHLARSTGCAADLSEVGRRDIQLCARRAVAAGAYSYPENSGGLLKIDPATGEETQLVVNVNSQTGYFAYPIQTEDGQIHFFYLTRYKNETLEEAWQWTLAQAEANMPITQPGNFVLTAHPAARQHLGQALWAPDASLAVLVTPVEIKLLERLSGALIPLGVAGYDLHWGINR